MANWSHMSRKLSPKLSERGIATSYLLVGVAALSSAIIYTASSSLERLRAAQSSITASTSNTVASEVASTLALLSVRPDLSATLITAVHGSLQVDGSAAVPIELLLPGGRAIGAGAALSETSTIRDLDLVQLTQVGPCSATNCIYSGVVRVATRDTHDTILRAPITLGAMRLYFLTDQSGQYLGLAHIQASAQSLCEGISGTFQPLISPPCAVNLTLPAVSCSDGTYLAGYSSSGTPFCSTPGT